MKKNKDGNLSNANIPVEGSLGLLALGAVGLRAWRKVKKSAIENKKAKNEKPKE